MTPYECDRDYGHSYNADGCCCRCNDYDEDYDQSFEEEDDDDDLEDEDVEVTKTVSGKNVYMSKKWLDRAKALLREKKVTVAEEACVVAEALEVEMGRKRFDRTVIDILVVAFRETEAEREVMAARLAQIRAKKAAKAEPEQPEVEAEPEHKGGPGLEAVKVTARKGTRRRAALERLSHG